MKSTEAQYENMVRSFDKDPFQFYQDNQPSDLDDLRKGALRHGHHERVQLIDLLFKRKMMEAETGAGSYKSAFDPLTGCLVRETDKKKRSYFSSPKHIRSPSPEMVDVSITQQCAGGCPYCYQDSWEGGEHADAELVRRVIEGFDTPPYQMAIGGGEPLLHPEFVDILKTVRYLGTMPNYTTGGTVELTGAVVEATNRYCGGVALTYHSWRGLPWFVERYQSFKRALTCQLNIHVIADNLVAKSLGELLEADLGRLNLVLLAYFPETGRASFERLMPKPVYQGTLPKVIKRALKEGHKISFSEGMLPYFLSRPKIGVDTTFAGRSEGLFSCYVDSKGTMRVSSFSDREVSLRVHGEDGWECEEATVFTTTSQRLWDEIKGGWFIGYGPNGGPCFSCKHNRVCFAPHSTHMHVCSHQPHNRRR